MTLEDNGPKISLLEIVDSVEDEIIVIDTQYRVRFANIVARRLFKSKTDSIEGAFCYELEGRTGPCSTPLWECPVNEVKKNHQSFTTIHQVNIDGVEKYLKITAVPLSDNGNNIKAIVELRRDVTAERELEIQILKRHHQLSVLNHISSAVNGLNDLDAVLNIALDNILELFSNSMGGILLLDEKTNVLSYKVHRGLSSNFINGCQVFIGEGIAGTVAESGQTVLVQDVSQDPRAARPTLVNIEGVKGFISVPLKTTNDRIVGVLNIFSHLAGRFGVDDVSLLNSIADYLGTTIEQARLYERLTRVGERYRKLLQYSLTVQEQERKRIAGELHDETAQSLTSMTLSLQALIGLSEIKGYTDPDFMDRLKKTHAYAVHAGQEVVGLMKELRPALLDELGLSAAIHRYAKDTLQTKNINVTTQFVGTDRRFQPEVEVSLYRIAQGAIGNIMKHSGAKNASVELNCDQNQCTLVIKDDGKGFDVDKLKSIGPGGRGAGLFIMRERTSLLGGSGTVESKPGSGTRVVACVPLERKLEDMVKDTADGEDQSTDS